MPQYTLSQLPWPPGAKSIYAYALNDDGDVAGMVYFPSDPGDPLWLRAVLWKEGGVTVLDTSPTESASWGINNADRAVGWLSWVYPSHAFLYTNGHVQDIHSALGPPAHLDSHARGVSNAGLVVGTAGPLDQRRMFLYNPLTAKVDFVDPLAGQYETFGRAVNVAGHAVGISTDANEWDRHAFLYMDGQSIDLGECGSHGGLGVNASDTIVGSKLFPGAPAWTAYRRRANGDFENLGHTDIAGYDGSTGNGINDHDVVVGNSHGIGMPPRAFVHFPAGSAEPGWYDLQNITTNAGSWSLEEAIAINNNGQILGNGTFEGQPRPFLLTPKIPFDLRDQTSDLAIAFIMLFGGVERGGGGWGIAPGGTPIPIDPEWWKRLPNFQKDMILGFAIRKVSALLDDRLGREIIERAGTEVVQHAIEKIERGT